MLYDATHQVFARNAVKYLDSLPEIPRPLHPHIVLPFKIEGSCEELFGIMDTAAPWCLIRWPLLEGSGVLSPVGNNYDLQARLNTRFGTISGELRRLTIQLFGEEGDSVSIDATVLVSEDWRAQSLPNFLGYEGFLQRLRFAVDPTRNQFHFGLAERDLSP